MPVIGSTVSGTLFTGLPGSFQARREAGEIHDRAIGLHLGQSATIDAVPQIALGGAYFGK